MTPVSPLLPAPSWLVAAPMAASLLAMSIVSASGLLGVPPFAPNPPRNVAEALAVSDAATAVRMFRAGADPSAVYEVRPGMIASELDQHVRPLAAAAFTSDDALVQLAKRFGATLPPAEARDAACWLAHKGREPIAILIAPAGWSASTCDPFPAEQ